MYAAGGGRAGFYDADLGANIPTTGDIDFYSSPILASTFDTFCFVYTVYSVPSPITLPTPLSLPSFSISR